MSDKTGKKNKEWILKESKKFFLEYGYEKGTVRQLGEKLQINPAMFSYYFSGKPMLGQYIVSDMFKAEMDLVEKILADSGSTPMRYYALFVYIHYMMLSVNTNLLRFYKEFVMSTGLSDFYFQIPDVRKLYVSFFSYYHLPQKYTYEQLANLTVGLDRQFILSFRPEDVKDDQFMRLMVSVLPNVIGVNSEIIEAEMAEAKRICSFLDLENFSF